MAPGSGGYQATQRPSLPSAHHGDALAVFASATPEHPNSERGGCLVRSSRLQCLANGVGRQGSLPFASGLCTACYSGPVSFADVATPLLHNLSAPEHTAIEPCNILTSTTHAEPEASDNGQIFLNSGVSDAAGELTRCLR